MGRARGVLLLGVLAACASADSGGGDNGRGLGGAGMAGSGAGAGGAAGAAGASGMGGAVAGVGGGTPGTSGSGGAGAGTSGSAGASGASGGGGAAGSAGGGGNTVGSGVPSGDPLLDRLTASSVTVPAGVKAGVRNWRIWAAVNLRVAPVYTAPLANCGTLVCYTTGTAAAPERARRPPRTPPIGWPTTLRSRRRPRVPRHRRRARRPLRGAAVGRRRPTRSGSSASTLAGARAGRPS